MKYKKAQLSSVLPNAVIYLVLVGIFAVFIFFLLEQHRNAASYWESFYAEEIARAIDMAKPGDYITIDLDKASIIAKKNSFEAYDKLVNFDNDKQEIIVKLRGNGETRFSYFNRVKITEWNTELGVPVNVLHFKVEDKNSDLGEAK